MKANNSSPSDCHFRAETKLHMAFRLNNQGAHRIEKFQCQSAIRCLRESLGLAKEVMGDYVNKHPRDSCDRNSRCSLPCSPLFEDCMTLPSKKNVKQAHREKKPGFRDKYENNLVDLDEETEFIYDHPIYVSKTSFHAESETKVGKTSLTIREQSVVLASMVLFNLALAYHMFALRNSKELQGEYASVLFKSAKLYDLAYTVLTQECIDCGALFMMSTANNLAQVYKAIGDHGKAKKFSQHLLSTLVYLTEYGFYDLGAIECFLRSTSHLILQERVAAAA